MTESHTMSSQSPPQIAVWGATDVGRTREGNEDSIFPDSIGQGGFVYNLRPETLTRKGQLLIVADGVGGAQGGREASQWAIQRAVERYYDLAGADVGNDLHAAVVYANASLVDYLQHHHMPEAGCTMTAAVIHGTTLYIANVGDSRTYLIRDGKAYLLTRDHTLTQQKIDQGRLRPEEAPLDPDKSVLTRSMGATPSVQVDLFRQPLQPGDRVLLCSDGLHDMLNSGEIARDASGGSLKRATTKLIDAANRHGGFDNISVVLAQVGERAQGGGGTLLNLQAVWETWPRQRQIASILLSIVAAIVVLALCGWVGWSMFEGNRSTDGTTTPTLTQTTIPINEEPSVSPSPIPTGMSEVNTATVTPTAQASQTAPNATATLMPTNTSTPTNTPRPPTATPTTPPPTSPPPPPPPTLPPATHPPASPQPTTPPPTTPSSGEKTPPPPPP